jgi:hypothetical protein
MQRFTHGAPRRPLVLFAMFMLLALVSLVLSGAVHSQSAAADTASGPVNGIAGKCLTSTASNSPVVISTCDHSASQIWSVPGDQTLRNGSQCLDVHNGGTTPGLRVWLWSCNGSSAQAWAPGPNNTLVNTRSQLCLDAVNGASTDGTPIQIWSCNGSSAQAWTLPAGDSTTTGGSTTGSTTGGSTTGGTTGGGTGGGDLVGFLGNGNKCLTATKTGPVVIEGCEDLPSQAWTVPDDKTIRNADNCLSVAGGSTQSGARVVVSACDSSGAQQWVPGGNKSLVNPQSGLCLDVSGASTADDTPIQIYTCNGTYAQQWTTQPATGTGSTGEGDGGPLVIGDIVAQNATLGLATGFLPTVTGGNGQYQWSAKGLPAGLSMNYINGTVMGAPTQVGSNTVTVTVTDAVGVTDSATFTWKVAAAVTATAYYLDCSAAANGNGTQNSPWNSLATANTHTFTPGESLLLKKGSTCNGQLAPQGNGSATAPITLSSYGTGSAPIVAGAGNTGEGATVQLTNQSYWIIQNLEVTNNSATAALRSGIDVYITDAQRHEGITIRNNDVHDVRGWSNRSSDLNAYYLSHGIGVDTPAQGSYIKGLTIADNYVHEIHGIGIGLYGDQRHGDNANPIRNQSVHVVGNTVRNTSQDAIVVSVSDSPLTEHNIADRLGWEWEDGVYAGIWAWGDTNPTFQYNEVSNILQSTADSVAWDCDGYIRGTCTYQYNYDHDNANGILLTCPGCLGPEATKVVYRYNLSVNDCRLHNATGAMKSYAFYGNTVDCRNKNWEFNEVPNFTKFSNNIFIGRSGASLPNGPTYSGNTYIGFTPPTDPSGSTADPKFVTLPPTSSYGINTAGHYQLLAGSPALNTGSTVTGNWGTDLWLNPLNTTNPNRGLYGGPGLSPARTDDSGAAYTGSWSTGACTGCQGGSAHTSTAAGASATFTVSGRTISLYGIQSSAGGVATVSIDGGAPVEISQYTPGATANGQIVYTSPRLAAGSHTVTVTNTGHADPRSSGTAVSLDSYTVSG